MARLLAGVLCKKHPALSVARKGGLVGKPHQPRAPCAQPRPSRRLADSPGSRPERSTADAAAQCFGVLSRKANAEWVLEGDIQGCFDNISHDWLIANIPMDKAILQKWLRAGYVYQKQLFPSHA